MVNDRQSYQSLGSFHGVAVPRELASSTRFMLFVPIVPAESLSYIRMLGNYKRNASLKNWCFKSSFFVTLNYMTPDQLRLDQQTPNGYVHICAKLIFLAAHKKLTKLKFEALSDLMKLFDYYKVLDFENPVSKKSIFISRICKIAKSKKQKNGEKHNKQPHIRYPSEVKLLLIELMISRQFLFNDADLLTLYNGIIYREVKMINKKTVNQTLH